MAALSGADTVQPDDPADRVQAAVGQHPPGTEHDDPLREGLDLLRIP